MPNENNGDEKFTYFDIKPRSKPKKDLVEKEDSFTYFEIKPSHDDNTNISNDKPSFTYFETNETPKPSANLERTNRFKTQDIKNDISNDKPSFTYFNTRETPKPSADLERTYRFKTQDIKNNISNDKPSFTYFNTRETPKPFNDQNLNIEKKEDVKTPNIQNNTSNSESKINWEDFFNSMNNQSSKKKSEELIKVGERKSEQFKNIFTEENQEPQAFMTNNQTKKEQEKSVLTVSEFLEEELEFLKEEHISIQDSDSKWSWLTNELAEKYFISVFLPYYIIKPNLSYDELDQLGFEAFISKLKRQKIHFSQIKSKYLNLDMQKPIDLLSEKFGTDTTSKKLENAKNRLENITDTISRTSILRSRSKLKLLFDLEFFPIKCKECNIGVDLFGALHFHHPTDSKEITLSDIYTEDYKLILEKFKKDKVELLCSNHHVEKQLFYPNTFKDIIFKEDLFSMSAEEIDAYIDDYLSVFAKTERYKEILYEKYVLKKIEVPNRINDQWKYQIKKWIKKRFVFKELFDGKCVICGDSNLSHLGLHHIDPNLKDLIETWQSIFNFDCDEIMRIIIKEKCVCLCSNCHALITFKYHISIRDVLKGFFSQQEIDKISEKVTLKYNAAIERISNFKYDLANINFKCPLKLEFSQNDMWKIHLMTVYYYLEIKERIFFLSTEIIYDLELSHNFISVVIKNLIDMGFVQKPDSSINYYLTQKGIDKILELIQRHCKKANEIKKKIKEILNNKGRYEFLDYTYSKENNCHLKKKIHSREESIFKYCLIIYDLTMNKGINEFTTSELIPFIRNNDNDLEITISNRITETIRSVLIPFNLIEKVDNPISYSYKKKNIDDSKMPISLAAKVYKLTDKGFDIANNGFDSL